MIEPFIPCPLLTVMQLGVKVPSQLDKIRASFHPITGSQIQQYTAAAQCFYILGTKIGTI